MPPRFRPALPDAPLTQATADDLRCVGLGLGDVRLQWVWLRLYNLIPKQSRVLLQKSFAFDARDLEVGGHVYVDGYWQSERYFKGIDSLVRQHLVVTTPLSVQSRELLDQIAAEETVCLNVRRADFVNHPLHRSLDAEYFARAIEEMRGRLGRAFRLLVFSDDIEWCRENLRLGVTPEFVGHEFAGAKFSTYFSLMSACKHFIIPNSSFAWWAAWLATNPDKVVIGPLRWFADPKVDTSNVLPDDWIRV